MKRPAEARGPGPPRPAAPLPLPLPLGPAPAPAGPLRGAASARPRVSGSPAAAARPPLRALPRARGRVPTHSAAASRSWPGQEPLLRLPRPSSGPSGLARPAPLLSSPFRPPARRSLLLPPRAARRAQLSRGRAQPGRERPRATPEPEAGRGPEGGAGRGLRGAAAPRPRSPPRLRAPRPRAEPPGIAAPRSGPRGRQAVRALPQSVSGLGMRRGPRGPRTRPASWPGTGGAEGLRPAPHRAPRPRGAALRAPPPRRLRTSHLQPPRAAEGGGVGAPGVLPSAVRPGPARPGRTQAAGRGDSAALPSPRPLWRPHPAAAIKPTRFPPKSCTACPGWPTYPAGRL